MVEQQQQLFLREGIMEEHDDGLELSLSLGLSLRPRRTESAPEMTLKRKVSDVLNEEEFSGTRRKANVGGLRLYEGQDGKYVGKERGVGGVDGGNRSSVSSGSSSGGSDSYHSNSNAGGNSSDTSSASHSSHPRPNVPTTSPLLSPLLSSKEDTPLTSSNHKPCSKKLTSTNIIPKPSPQEPKVVTGKPPKPTRQMSQQSVLLPQMPCVSTTGKGPNGKTISGFLYKYSKTEVSIVCVCHGASFSPAGFVEHAGGEHVEHPLKHIRVVPFALT